MNVEEFASIESAFGETPQMPCEVTDVGLAAFLEVLQDMMHLRELLQM